MLVHVGIEQEDDGPYMVVEVLEQRLKVPVPVARVVARAMLRLAKQFR